MNSFARTIIVALVVGCPSVATAAEGILRTVALSGQAAAGAPGNAAYDSFGVPVVNATGQVAFGAILQLSGDVTSQNDVGVWSEGSGVLSLVAREGGQAPGAPIGTNFASLGLVGLNAAAQTAFSGALRGDAVNIDNDTGIWSELSGTLQQVAREGSAAPGMPAGTNFGGFEQRRLADESLAIAAYIQHVNGSIPTADNDTGIWRSDGNTLSLFVRESDQAPGMPPGALFSDLHNVNLGLSGSGRIAFVGALRLGAGGVTAGNNSGIWSESGGTLTAAVREGDQAPGMPPGSVFSEFQPVLRGLDAAGQVTFLATTQGGGVALGSNTGLWSQRDGALELVARASSQAPGLPAGALFGSFSFVRAVSVTGRTAFLPSLKPGAGGVDSTNEFGIWVETGGAVELIARKGSQAPGAPSGATFLFGGRTSTTMVLNAEGKLAFLTPLLYPTDNLGIWAQDLAGVLRLIVRKGDLLEVAPGDFRTVSNLSFDGGSGNEGGSSGFNDLGQVAFRATFTDGSWGVFVSNEATVPEPASLALAALLGTAGVWLKRGTNATVS